VAGPLPTQRDASGPKAHGPDVVHCFRINQIAATVEVTTINALIIENTFLPTFLSLNMPQLRMPKDRRLWYILLFSE
jgi:hypothetical protein